MTDNVARAQIVDLHMDFGQRVVVDSNAMAWQTSPSGSVLRKPLARAFAETGHATSVVRYLPGARFPRHEHPLGEEIFVLSGVFSDDEGDFGAGMYLRNPPGSGHAPYSQQGCDLLVKLHQFQSTDTTKIRVNTQATAWQPGQGGLRVMPLHQFGGESVALVHWPAGEVFQPHRHLGGEEIFVLEGELIDEHGRYPAGTWLRSPHLSSHYPRAEQDTLIWVKVGHLPVNTH